MTEAELILLDIAAEFLRQYSDREDMAGELPALIKQLEEAELKQQAWPMWKVQYRAASGANLNPRYYTAPDLKRALQYAEEAIRGFDVMGIAKVEGSEQ